VGLVVLLHTTGLERNLPPSRAGSLTPRTLAGGR
jgi:hypothetical protein